MITGVNLISRKASVASVNGAREDGGRVRERERGVVVVWGSYSLSRGLGSK